MSIVETERLELREMNLGDLDDMHAVLSDPVSMRHYPKPFDLKMTGEWIEWCLQNYAEHGFGLWAVIHKQDGRCIGDCGLTFQLVDSVQELEIGYHLLRQYQGQDLATEAACACRDYVFDRLGKTRVISWMPPDHIASRRVAEKAGMQFEKETVNRYGRPAVVYSIEALQE